MNPSILLATALAALAVCPPSYAEHPTEHPSAAPAKKAVTTKDIGDGIQKHIDDKSKEDKNGKFQVKDGEKDLALTLVKVHNDKLANLGGGSYFACVDFKGTDGNTYDVDFFLKGDPGAMTVTETNVHKVNGKPRYNWKEEGGKWCKVDIEKK